MGKHVRNADYTKQYNRKLLMKILSKKSLSRADLAREMGLTRAAISIICDELLQEGILLEQESVSSKRGRSPIPLSLNPAAFYAFGLFLSRTSCQIGLINIGGEVLCSTDIPIRSENISESASVEFLLSEISHTILSICDTHPELVPKILGIGISCPGPLDLVHGMILNPPGFDAWHGLAIINELTDRTGFGAHFLDNADALALYNLRFGSHPEFSNFLLLLVDTGVGSGIVLKDRIYHGAGGASPELGHISISYNGRKCGCGNKGCLETYAAIPNLLQDYHHPYQDWIKVLSQADAHSKEIIETEADYLSAGILTALNLFDFQCVYLSGDILDCYEPLKEALLEKITRTLSSQNKPGITILPSDTSIYCNIIAGANIMFSQFLDS